MNSEQLNRPEELINQFFTEWQENLEATTSLQEVFEADQHQQREEENLEAASSASGEIPTTVAAAQETTVQETAVQQPEEGQDTAKPTSKSVKGVYQIRSICTIDRQKPQRDGNIMLYTTKYLALKKYIIKLLL